MKTALRRPRTCLLTLSLTGMFALSGCQVLSPLETTSDYSPADGVEASTAEITVRDLVVLSTQEGQEGRLSGRVLNESGQDATLELSAGEEEFLTLELAPGETVQLAEEDVSVPPTPRPGSLMAVGVAAGEQEPELVQTPVLLPVDYYSELAPEGWAPPSDEPAGEGH